MLSTEVRDAVRSRDPKAVDKGGRLRFRCPRHEDSTPSAWMKDGSWGCFACGFTEPITTLAQELGVPLDGAGTGYTVNDYCAAKGFPATMLRAWGVLDEVVSGRDVVAIQYHDIHGKPLRRKFRDRKGKWWEGRNRPIYLYGLERLPEVQEGEPILVVEGESDCHAAWLSGFNAIGVPGATVWKSEWAEHLAGLDVYIWEEPDQGGPELVKRVAADFPKAKVLQGSALGFKDIAEMYRADPKAFPDRLRAAMVAALPVGTTKPPVAFDVLLSDRLDRLMAVKSAPIDAVPTPWPTWNRLCCGAGGQHGIARGWHVLAAARTGAGKSILAANVAWHAMRAGERVCFISLEMGQVELETRLLAIVANEPVQSLEQGRHFQPDALKAAGRRVLDLYEQTGGCLYTNREPIHRLPDVLDSMRFNHEVYGCRFFIVDYLQLAGNPLKPETIVAVSNQVRRLTMDLNVAEFGLSQFNRMTSMSKERPTKEGLMGGSALENDAVQVILIDHSSTSRLPGGGGYMTAAIIDKNRHGPTTSAAKNGTNPDIGVEFDTRTLRMTERAVERVTEIREWENAGH